MMNYIKTGHKDFIKWLLKAIWWNVVNKKDSTELGYPISRL